MSNNTNLRRLRYALNLRDKAVMEIFAVAGVEIGQARLDALYKQEDSPGYEEFSDALFGQFLDGLIQIYRGKRPIKEGERPPPPAPLTNNRVLRALKIALQLREQDMIAILNLEGMEVSKGELSALFRRADHRNYKKCGDQFLRNFIAGLGQHLRQER